MRRALLILGLCSFFAEGCVSSSQSSDVDEDLLSEPLPIPPHEEEASEQELAAEEPAAEEPAAEERGDAGEDAAVPPCALEPDAPSVVDQLRLFRRWLRDQSVGRRLHIIALESVCGDRGGALVIELTLEGPAGGLQSLSRALTNYYPGSSWTALTYERLEGEGVPLRLDVEVRLPVGAAPRPRCEWDTELVCEPSDDPASATPPADELLE